MSAFIVHLTSRVAWLAARAEGTYGADSLANDGFIHCSTSDQVVRVANTYYPGQHGLVLLVIDPGHLTSQVRWEPGSDKPDELFPHVYGPINLDAVVSVHDFEPDDDGRFERLPL